MEKEQRSIIKSTASFVCDDVFCISERRASGYLSHSLLKAAIISQDTEEDAKSATIDDAASRVISGVVADKSSPDKIEQCSLKDLAAHIDQGSSFPSNDEKIEVDDMKSCEKTIHPNFATESEKKKAEIQQ